MKKKIVVLLIINLLLNGCSKIPETHLIDHKGEGYFCGIIQPTLNAFIPMEFILTIDHDVDYLTEWDFEHFAVFFFSDNRKIEKKLEKISGYTYYFTIVKGEFVDFFPKNKSTILANRSFSLRIDKIVFLKVVDKEFVKCLFNKKISVEDFEFYRKHPKEILKLCPCKPLKKIKKGDNLVIL